MAHDYPYTLEGTSYTGYTAYPKSSLSSQQPAPGVFIGHTWNGLSSMEKWRCQQLASRVTYAGPGYVWNRNTPKTDSAAKAEMDKILSNLTSFYYMEYGMEILKLKLFQITQVLLTGLHCSPTGIALRAMVPELA